MTIFCTDSDNFTSSTISIQRGSAHNRKSDQCGRGVLQSAPKHCCQKVFPSTATRFDETQQFTNQTAQGRKQRCNFSIFWASTGKN